MSGEIAVAEKSYPEYINSQQFQAMLGTYKKSTRKKGKYYPQATNKGLWRKDQAEDYAEILSLEALSGINHLLIAINAHIARILRASSKMFRLHGRFLSHDVPDAIKNTNGRIHRVMELEYDYLKPSKRELITDISEVRQKIKNAIVEIRDYPPDCGQDAYIEAMDQMFIDLNQLQKKVDETGRPLLFNAFSRHPLDAYKHFLKGWKSKSAQEQTEELKNFQNEARRYAQFEEDVLALADEYAANAELMQQLNRELRDRRKEAHKLYMERVIYGDYPLRSRPIEMTGNYFVDAVADELGNYTISIPAAMAGAMNFPLSVRLELSVLGNNRIIIRNMDDPENRSSAGLGTVD
ncbi:hypothetical protein H0K60_004463 [Salmonella enterica]|nr:hypothetical protein [Salmonella enterica]EFR2649707.1 hypothetical protein [Salmonella enterica]EFS1408056.1 hypothetical protein [Salmonella enterica]EHQ8162503.1 hypothetical protein [Salmonella enterica]EJZ9218156.1 hypothetical protein [Salmonella enterica]